MTRWLARSLAALVIACGLVPLTAGASWACSCATSGFTESQEWRSVAAKAPLVYVADVVAVTQAEGQNRYSLRVVESLKGGATGTRTVTTSDQGSTCGVTIPQGRRILVAAEPFSLCGGYTQDRVEQRTAIVRAALAGKAITHVVARGDWLWQLARTELVVQGRSFARPSDAAVQRAARRLHEANRRTIGADPDRLRAGMRLTVPRLV